MTRTQSLLVAGGRRDPNVASIVAAAAREGVAVIDARVGDGRSPSLTWDLACDSLSVDGRVAAPDALFMRYDVFESLADPRPAVSARALGWHETLAGWTAAHPRVRAFNRRIIASAGNKPAQLMAANAIGLTIPSTVITNDLAALGQDAGRALVAKPVAGGDYCVLFADASSGAERRHGRGARPAIVQRRLQAPEVRIYVIGRETFAFEMRSPSLDYRVDQNADVMLLDTVPAVVHPLRALMDVLGMDFGAADFKTDPGTGALVFLEINTSPMFAQFDAVASGQLCAAVVRELSRVTRRDPATIRSRTA
jgi:glutathione synthase/RimK-type ligase-like ATP-grasp enzyme